MTKCNQCGFKGFREFFTKTSSKLCKRCDAINSKARRRTKKGVIASMYSHQKASSNRRGHPQPNYTQLELREWLFSQKRFHILYSNWVNNNFEVMLKPSCDRDDCRLHYSLSNLTLMSWGENHAKASDEIMSGKVGAKSKMVRQLTINGLEVNIFKSIRDVKRKLGYDDSFIIKVCKGVYKSAYGFKWEYYND